MCLVAVACGDQHKGDEQSVSASSVDVAAATTAPVEEGDVGAGDGYWADDYTGPELPLVVHRTDAQGAEVWVRVGPPSNQVAASPTGWVPPAWCYPAGMARVTFVQGSTVGEKYFNYYAGLRGDALVKVVQGGYADGTPLQVYVFQVSDSVTAVQVADAQDVIDRSTPEDGWAVVVAPGEYDDSTVLSFVDGAGDVQPVTDFSGEWTDAFETGCYEPEASLPSPGEQPDDAAAAESALRARFDELWAGDTKAAERYAEYIDDDTGLVEATDEVLGGQYADLAVGVHRLIGDLVFVSPSEAWFRYYLSSTEITQVSFFGHAYLVDGKWVFVRAMVCQEIALTNVQCSPPELKLVPPQT